MIFVIGIIFAFILVKFFDILGNRALKERNKIKFKPGDILIKKTTERFHCHDKIIIQDYDGPWWYIVSYDPNKVNSWIKEPIMVRDVNKYYKLDPEQQLLRDFNNDLEKLIKN